METPDRVSHAPATDAIPPQDPDKPTGLVIRVSTGSGAGPTRLAAFDTAVQAAGIAGYNIIRLSSVIPSQSVVRQVTGGDQVKGSHGDVVYCVYAAAYASMPGEQAWAGLAWATHADGSGAGIFVEHTAASESVLRRDLAATIDTMSLTRGHLYQVAGQIVSTAICVDHPACAVAVAVYGTAGWRTLIDPEG